MAHLGFVDDQLGRNPVKVLEGPAVAGQPGLHLLVGDDLGIHMPAEAKGHDEDPGGNDFPGKNIRDGGTFAKIHLGRLPRRKVQDTGGVRVLFFSVAEPGGALMNNCRKTRTDSPALHE